MEFKQEKKALMCGIKDMFGTIKFNKFQARYSDLRSRLKHVCTLHPASTLLRRLRMKMVSCSDLQIANSTGASDNGLTAPQAFIPDDLIYNILLRLRFKTVCKFKCVSKSWHTMISSSNFLNDHRRAGHLIVAALSKKSKIAVVCLDTEGTLLDKFTLPRLRLTEDDNSYCFVSSHLELICIDSDSKTFVLNPTTKEFFVIPKKKPRDHHEPQTVGFGYVPSIKKYKVIHFIDLECRVFTLGVDRNWRKAPSAPFEMYNLDPAFVNGAIYICVAHVNGKVSISRFDLEKEVWSSISDPPMEFSEGFVESICELGGNLCIVEKIRGGVFNIWMLKDCNKDLWVKEYYELKIPDGFCCYPLVIEEDKRILVRVMEWPDYNDRLCYFDVNGNICGEVKIPDDCLITTCVESSFSII